MKFDIYSKIYLESIITEENVKAIIPIIQQKLFNTLNVRSYQEIIDKVKFQQDLNNELERIKEKVESITSNMQYQSWIYRILKNQDKDIDEDYEVIRDAINDFIKLCKHPDLTAEQRNIINYLSFQDLQKFILGFQNTHKLNNDIYSNLKLLYQNNGYKCYLIPNYEECNRLFGGREYFNSGWCVAKNKRYYNDYLRKIDKYNGYIVFIKNNKNKPYALLHYGSEQFKDVSDNSLTDKSEAIIDCLYNLNDDFQQKLINDDFHFYENSDLTFYKDSLIKMFIEQNNLIDRLQKIDKNTYIINSVFDFECIKYLYENNLPKIILGDYFTNDIFRELIFTGIESIEELRFNNNITNINYLFYNNKTLKSVNFTNTLKIISMDYLFYGCQNLVDIKIENTANLKSISAIFYNCLLLQTVPLFDTSNVINMDYMFAGCELLKEVPLFDTSTVKNMKGMFMDCQSLQEVPLFDISNVKNMRNMRGMFNGCDILKNQGYPIDNPLKCFEIARQKNV